MKCPWCDTASDHDAVFCERCGQPLGSEPAAPPSRQRRAYLSLLFLIPAFFVVIGLGYYKFFLPDGAVAVVNGEEIKRSELDAAVARTQRVHEALSGRSVSARGLGKEEIAKRRYEALSDLIRERLLLQEARKAGVEVSAEDVAVAMAATRASFGVDEEGFRTYIETHYGGVDAFERIVRRRLLINTFISQKVVAGISDPQAARAAVNRWLQEVSARAAVRVSLSEQWSGAGCGCCAGGRGVPEAAGSPGKLSPEAEKAVVAAGLKYWREKYGQEGASARLTDFGCHIQIDILKDNKTVKSLRYQDGKITEM